LSVSSDAKGESALELLTTVVEKAEEPAGRLSLVVMGPDAAFNRELTPGGQFTIGRSEAASIRLADTLASRLHACVYVSSAGSVEIEDLDSANGTKLRSGPLKPRERVPLPVGEVITIGTTLFIVQTDQRLARPRSTWSHEYFEARLDELCARSDRTSAPFAVIRLQATEGNFPPGISDVIGSALRPQDVLGVFGPADYEVLLLNTPPELALAIAPDLMARLGGQGTACRAGTACFPRDGRAAAMLLSCASERLRAGSSSVADDGAPIIEEPSMRRLYDIAQRAAAATISVLIIGETGVGKEIVAEAVHRMSPRAKAPLVCLNCAALPENLLESELFGHERGAFTGATEAKVGLLETAPGGTVFLDEIGEIPLTVQTKLLRVLETRQVTRVGGLKPRSIDVRFIAATNRRLEGEIAQGRFRQDLFFRLNGIMLQVPPLRERPSEIMALATRFLVHFSRQMGRQSAPVLSKEATALLKGYGWPGNIRELRNVIERAVVLCVGGEISLDHLPVDTMIGEDRLGHGTFVGSGVPPAPVAADEGGTERDRIVHALNEYAGNQSRAAKQLGIARSTLIEKIELYGIPRPRKPTAL
jgi:DNA-binding NtrC family response regulator